MIELTDPVDVLAAVAAHDPYPSDCRRAPAVWLVVALAAPEGAHSHGQRHAPPVRPAGSPGTTGDAPPQRADNRVDERPDRSGPADTDPVTPTT